MFVIFAPSFPHMTILIKKHTYQIFTYEKCLQYNFQVAFLVSISNMKMAMPIEETFG